MTDIRRPCSRMPELSTKPDVADAAGRWEALWHGEILDRPVVTAEVPRTDPPAPPVSYRQKCEDLDAAIHAAIDWAEDGNSWAIQFPPSVRTSGRTSTRRGWAGASDRDEVLRAIDGLVRRT